MTAAVVGVVGITVPVLVVRRGDDHPDQWDARLTELVRFVERERGLEFDHPVAVEFLTVDEYAERTRVSDSELEAEDREMLEQISGYLRALGLASGDVDLLDAANDLATSGTLAFYDSEDEQIVVRGTEMSVNVRVTLAHELTHALQDQHFDLDRMISASGEADDGDSSRKALTALVEGDATRIENRYLAQLPGQELDEYASIYGEEAAEAEQGLAEVPAALVAAQLTPYVLGEPLVRVIADEGGNTAVDQAFADPPSTGEHVFDPRSYLAAESVTALDTPELPDGADEELHEGQFGAVELYLVLAERIDPLVALDAADGWGNGRYVIYDTDRTCVRIALDGDTPSDDQQLKQAFDLWAVGTPPEAGAAVSDLGGGVTLVESCDPGTAADSSDDRALEVITLPVARAQIAADQLQQGASLEAAWATGDCFVRHVALDDLTAAYDGAADSGEFRDRVNDAWTACHL